MGRPKKPTNLKVLEGNRGKRKLPKGEVSYDLSKNPAPPDWLNEEGKALWKRIAPLLVATRCLTDADLPAFEGMCQTWGEYVEFERTLAEDGYVFKTPNGYVQSRPEAVLADKALSRFHRLAARFGLTPADRAGLVLEVKEESENPMESLFARK